MWKTWKDTTYLKSGIHRLHLQHGQTRKCFLDIIPVVEMVTHLIEPFTKTAFDYLSCTINEALDSSHPYSWSLLVGFLIESKLAADLQLV